MAIVLRAKVKYPKMTDIWASGRRCLALGLLALLPAAPVTGQAKVSAPATASPGPAARSLAPLMVVNDGRGMVTVVGEQASPREVLRVLSRWFEFPGVNLDAIPDTGTPMRFERVPVGQVVDRLLRNAGLPTPPGGRKVKAVTAPRSSAPLMVVHDGHGLVTVMAEQASLREVLGLLSRWFDFPIASLDAIPDIRSQMHFERLPVGQVVDRLLRNSTLNYVILTNPETLVPTKVLAAQHVASSAPAGRSAPEVRRYLPNPTLMPNPNMMPGMDGAPMPMPMPMPIDTIPGYQVYPPPLASEYAMPQPPNAPPAMPAPAPSSPAASRPGVMTPPPIQPAPGTKPPGQPNQ